MQQPINQQAVNKDVFFNLLLGSIARKLGHEGVIEIQPEDMEGITPNKVKIVGVDMGFKICFMSDSEFVRWQAQLLQENAAAMIKQAEEMEFAEANPPAQPPTLALVEEEPSAPVLEVVPTAG